MVAIIKTGSSISRILNYNESKVSQGVASCIAAINYPCQAGNLTFNMKYNRLSRLAALNENVSRNSVHISLNFDASDHNLSRDRLEQIAQAYMQKIGFAEQPYIVYQHNDAGHPHIHIVSVKVRADGSRIDMHNIGRNQSESARREIEKTYDLLPADSRKKSNTQDQKVPQAIKAVYGKMQTKSAIAKVLNVVLTSYKFTSLAELNAVLSEFNIRADRGGENSRIYKHSGLVYRIIDENKMPVGVPIKSSRFYPHATLKQLELSFPKHRMSRSDYKPHLRNKIEQALAQKPKGLLELKALLQNKGVGLHLRQNDSKEVYGLTFVDHATKCVFNGSALGKTYSASPLQEKLKALKYLGNITSANSGQSLQSTIANNKNEPHSLDISHSAKQSPLLGSMDSISSLMQAENISEYLPKALTKKKKRKRNISR